MTIDGLVVRVVAGPDAGTQAALGARLPIGRAAGGLMLRDERVSRFHAVLDVAPTSAEPGGPAAVEVTLADAGSSGGTLLNGAEIQNPVAVRPGSLITLGASSLLLLRAQRHTLDDGDELLLVAPDDTSSTFRLDAPGVTTIGRHGDVVIDDPAVSRRHLELRRAGDRLIARDLGSRNGVSVHGRRIEGDYALRPGDELLLRGSGWRIRLPENAPAPPPTLELLVRAEPGSGGGAGTRSVRLTITAGARVGAVAAALAEWLGCGGSDASAMPWTLYRAEDGLLLHPEDAWLATPLQRGDTLTVARAELPEHLSSEAAALRASTTVNIVPRLKLGAYGDHFVLPRPPDAATFRGRGLLWQLSGGALGVLGGLALGLVTGNWMFALFGAIAGIGTLGFGILAEHSRRRAQARDFRDRLAVVRTEITAAVEAEGQRRVGESPPESQWSEIIRSHRAPLWVRRPNDPDFLALVLGTGNRIAAVDIQLTPGAESGELLEEAKALAGAHTLPPGPVTGPDGGVLGIAGPPRAVDELAAHALIEAALLHAPSSLAITVLGSDEAWDWSRWLPHLSAADAPGGVSFSRDPASAERLALALLERVSAIRPDPAAPGVTSPQLVLVTRSAAVLDGAIARLIERWRRTDGLLLVLSDDERRLPLESHSRVLLADNGEAVRLLGEAAGTVTGSLLPARLPRDRAAVLARSLGRLSDPRHEQLGAAASRPLVELAGLLDDGRIDIAGARARRARGRLDAVIGVDDEGRPYRVDLSADGPHGIIAGTTGSGKSEVLTSIIAALTATRPPSELALFLIDFKGGATFSRFAELPHIAGLVTDLEGDSALARRAFTALEAELARRKELLGRAGCPDLRAYRARGEPFGPLPSLLVVIDEFALLVQQQPEVKPRLDAVAAQGRSLGVHLLLATQSPSGVITPAIRANTNLWLSLRVVNVAESRELLGTDAAALLPVDRPGLVLARRGAEPKVARFSCARVTVPDQRSAGVSIEAFADEPAAAATTQDAADDTDLPTQLDRLIQAIREHAALSGDAPAARLWLPPLPRRLRLGELPAAPAEAGVGVGLADLVGAAAQPVWRVDVTASHTLVTGAPGSGRTSALRTIAAACATKEAPSTLHIYALTAERSLDELLQLPHTAAVVHADDRERVGRLLHRLGALVETRRAAESDEGPAVLLLLVDDYPAVRDALGEGEARELEALHRLFTNGRSGRIHAVISAVQPTDLRLAVAGAFGTRLLLRAVDRADYLSIDWRPGGDELPDPVPGRAMVEGPIEVQLADTDDDALRQLAANWPAEARPRAIDRLPDTIDQAALLAAHPGAPVIGLGGPELEPVLAETVPGAHLAVLGEHGTGRSTALAAYVAAELATATTAIFVAARRAGPLDELAPPGVIARDRDGLSRILEQLESQPPPQSLLVIDDADTLVADLGERLERLMRDARDTGLRVLVSARAADWARSFDPWTRYLTGLRRGLLLSNHLELGPLFDVRLPSAATAPAPAAPGRGYLVAPGSVLHLQLAQPSSAIAPADSGRAVPSEQGS